MKKKVVKGKKFCERKSCTIKQKNVQKKVWEKNVTRKIIKKIMEKKWKCFMEKIKFWTDRKIALGGNFLDESFMWYISFVDDVLAVLVV